MKKVNVRLMDTDADYQKMHTKKDCIEVWEDGKRDDDRAGALKVDKAEVMLCAREHQNRWQSVKKVIRDNI